MKYTLLNKIGKIEKQINRLMTKREIVNLCKNHNYPVLSDHQIFDYWKMIDCISSSRRERT